MYDTDSKGISYTAGFFMLIGFTIIAFLIAGIISIPIWTSMTGKPFLDMEKGMSDPAYSDVARILQVINAVIGFLLPAIFTAYLVNRKPMRLIGFSTPVKAVQVLIVVVMMSAALFVSTSLSYFNEIIPIPQSWKLLFDEWERAYNEMAAAIIGLNSFAEFLLAIFIMAFLPALCEEALFRGGLQNFLARSTRSQWLAVIIISLIFSAVHFSYYGFLARFFLGAVLGLIFVYTGSLWLCIIGHFVNNAVAITLLYIAKIRGMALEEAMNFIQMDPYWGIALTPVVIGLLILLKRISPITPRWSTGNGQTY